MHTSWSKCYIFWVLAMTRWLAFYSTLRTMTDLNKRNSMEANDLNHSELFHLIAIAESYYYCSEPTNTYMLDSTIPCLLLSNPLHKPVRTQKT